MAADAVPMTLSGGGSVSQPTAQARAAGSPSGPDMLSGRSASGSGPGSAEARPLSAHSSESHAARTSTDESAGSGSPAAGAADSSGSPASRPPRSTESGTHSDGPNSRRPTAAPGRPGRGASAASPSRSAQAAENPAAASTDFSAALAQSLAANPAGPAENAPGSTPATGDATDARAAGKSGEPVPKHSTTDPVSSALSLLEQALAGALTAIPPAPPVSGAGPAPAGGSSSGSLLPDALGGKGAAAALNALLPQNPLFDPKPGAAGASNAAGPTAAAAAAGASGTAAATLTAAAQLSSAVPVGLTHGTADPSAMALSSPVGTHAWTEELGAKMTWMSSQGIESASLRLSPEHLGPLQVNISVHEGQASVWFGAAQPETRTALEQSLPQLRQLFAGQGLMLTDAGVSREPPRGHARQPAARAAAPVCAVVAASSDGSAVRATAGGGLGLLDTYA
jgi:flagellar hook-length control protein FliK